MTEDGRPGDPPDGGQDASGRPALRTLAARGLASPAGARLRAARKRHRDRVLRSTLRSRRRAPALVDAFSRLLVGRAAGRAELRRVRDLLDGDSSVDAVVAPLLDAPDGRPQQVRLAARLAAQVMHAEWEEPAHGEPTLVFLHTMKVGGVSLTDSLVRAAGPGRALPHLYVDEVVALPVSLLRSARVITGHLPYEALEVVPGPLRTATVLRDPVARTLSHYRHLRALAPTLPGVPDDLTLDRFLEDPQFAVVSGNYQARQFAHTIDLAGAWVRYDPVERYRGIGGDPANPYPLQSLFDATPQSPDEDELAALALAHLDRIDLVGTTEQMAAFSDLLASRLAGGPTGLRTLNVSAPAPDDAIDARVRRRIDERTGVDRALHDRALERQAEWLAGLPAELPPAERSVAVSGT